MQINLLFFLHLFLHKVIYKNDPCTSPDLLTLDTAIQNIVDSVKQHPHSLAVEQVEVSSAFNRIVAEDIFSTIDVPPTNNSAMDGYALIAEDLSK